MRKAVMVGGAVTLAGVLWFGLVYGCVCEFAKAVGDG